MTNKDLKTQSKLAGKKVVSNKNTQLLQRLDSYLGTVNRTKSGRVRTKRAAAEQLLFPFVYGLELTAPLKAPVKQLASAAEGVSAAKKLWLPPWVSTETQLTFPWFSEFTAPKLIVPETFSKGFRIKFPSSPEEIDILNRIANTPPIRVVGAPVTPKYPKAGLPVPVSPPGLPVPVGSPASPAVVAGGQAAANAAAAAASRIPWYKNPWILGGGGIAAGTGASLPLYYSLFGGSGASSIYPWSSVARSAGVGAGLGVLGGLGYGLLAGNSRDRKEILKNMLLGGLIGGVGGAAVPLVFG